MKIEFNVAGIDDLNPLQFNELLAKLRETAISKAEEIKQRKPETLLSHLRNASNEMVSDTEIALSFIDSNLMPALDIQDMVVESTVQDPSSDVGWRTDYDDLNSKIRNFLITYLVG